MHYFNFALLVLDSKWLMTRDEYFNDKLVYSTSTARLQQGRRQGRFWEVLVSVPLHFGRKYMSTRLILAGKSLILDLNLKLAFGKHIWLSQISKLMFILVPSNCFMKLPLRLTKSLDFFEDFSEYSYNRCPAIVICV